MNERWKLLSLYMCQLCSSPLCWPLHILIKVSLASKLLLKGGEKAASGNKHSIFLIIIQRQQESSYLCVHITFMLRLKIEINTLLCLMSWTSRYDSALNRHDLYTRGHNDWSSFQTKSCLMINIIYLRTSINDSLTTRESLWTHCGHRWSQWGYRWTVYEKLTGDELVLWRSIRSVCQRGCS